MQSEENSVECLGSSLKTAERWTAGAVALPYEPFCLGRCPERRRAQLQRQDLSGPMGAAHTAAGARAQPGSTHHVAEGAGPLVASCVPYLQLQHLLATANRRVEPGPFVSRSGEELLCAMSVTTSELPDDRLRQTEFTRPPLRFDLTLRAGQRPLARLATPIMPQKIADGVGRLLRHDAVRCQLAAGQAEEPLGALFAMIEDLVLS